MNDGIEKVIAEKKNYDSRYHNLMYSFVMKAYELVDLSEGVYQIEHTIKLNQISLKDYILNSEVCLMLKNNNISNYSIEELKKYLEQYEYQNLANVKPYKIAIELYEKLDEIEQIENDQISYELDSLSIYLADISKIKDINKEEYSNLYNNLIIQVKSKYAQNTFQEEIIEILNDIFNYYVHGNKDIEMF